MAALYLLHPIVLFVISNSIVTFAAAFTDRGSPVRFAALPILAVLSYIFPWSHRHFVGTTGWTGRVPAGAMFWNIITCFDRLIRRGWDYKHYGPWSYPNDVSQAKSEGKYETNASNSFPGTRMNFGAEVTGHARGIGCFWEVKNVPYFSKEDPQFVPSRAAFVLVHSITVVSSYYINNITANVSLSQDPHLLDSNHIPFLTRLPEVTMTELRVRVVATLGYWIVQCCNMQFFYSACALLNAILSPQCIEFWRPLFGSPKDAYTVRNFWGKSWHQTLRSGLQGFSEFTTHDVLQLPHQGLLQRYTKIFCSFALSGTMHIFADAGGGLSMSQSGALHFFCIQALGIMIEDGVQAIWRDRFRSTTGRFERVVGYAWVLFFLVWTSPVWVFSVSLNMRKEDAMLSFDALKTLFVPRSRSEAHSN